MGATAALAGGVAPVVPVVVATPLSPTLTFGFEVSPEFYATSKAGSYASGDLADTVLKLSLSKALKDGFSVAGSLAETMREPSTKGVASTYNQFEVKVGYKWKATPQLSVPMSATLGYAFGEMPKIDPNDPTAPEAYYAVNIGADYKINSAMTFNVIDVRYRNAFDVQWETPKVTTGFTYAMSPTGSIYANFGKSWKNTGTGYNPDKYSLAFGFKFLF
jgi:hypothetical protein